MAKITAASYIEGISGKVCKHSQDEFRTNSTSGTIVLSKKCNPYNGEATEKQKTQRSVFAARVMVVKQWLTDNRPSTANPKGTDLYQEAEQIKKTEHLSNVQAALFLYQAKTSPYAITLPSEGGVKAGQSVTNSSSDTGGI